MRKLVLGLGCLFVGIGGQIIQGNVAIAQNVIPDGTLGPDGSRVGSGIVRGESATLITGGAARGSSLFHSFSTFNVGEGERTYFANPAGIQNILSRVTGNSPSNILGTLGVAGAANLFFVNPRGIIFGPNARLDIGGSLTLTTAGQLNLSNGATYSAIDPQAPPLLTVDVTPGLQTGRNFGGSIINRGANLFVEGPRIELAADRLEMFGGRFGGRNGTDIRVTAPTIVLTDKASIYSNVFANSPDDGGKITITTQNLSGSGGSTVQSITVGSKAAGDVIVRPFDPSQPSTVSFDGYAVFTRLNADDGLPNGGFSSGFILSTEDLPTAPGSASGKGGFLFIDGITNLNLSNGAVISGRSRSSGIGGNIAIDVKNLNITGGAQINVSASKTGEPGNLLINAENINISGFDPTRRSRIDEIRTALVNRGTNSALITEILRFTLDTAGPISSLTTSVFKEGTSKATDAGFIIVNASQSITLADRAEISSLTEARNVDAGLISISTGKTYGSALDLLTAVLNADRNRSDNFNAWANLGGGGSLTLDNSRIFSTVEAGATGNAGPVRISTGRLTLTNAAQIQTLVRGQDGATPGGVGNAGLITVNATDSVRISGYRDEVENGQPRRFRSSLFSSVGEGARGNSGVIGIRTPLLYLNDRGLVSTSNFSPDGLAGYILVESNFIVLDRQSTLASVSRSGEGGNIGLQSRYLVGVSRESRISTAAGTVATPGIGGNVVIGTDLRIDGRGDVRFNTLSPTLLTYGFPFKDSDIVANAFGKQGGRIEISTFSLRNLATRKDTILSDDLDASSTVEGLDGLVVANSYNLDPDRGLQPVPERVNKSRLSEGCDPNTLQEVNAFRQSGSGRIANNPTQRLNLKVAARTTVSESPNPIPPLNPAIGWFQTPDGKLQMIAATPGSDPNLPTVASLCPS